MDISEFENSVTEHINSLAIRSRYIEKFVDTGKEHYKKYIGKQTQFVDGMCYTGYLWDCLNEGILIDFDDLISKVSSVDVVKVLWDIHSCERIWIQDYWKFPKDMVISMKSAHLIESLLLLPEDIYIFDEDLKWTLILTHEDIDGKRICLQSGSI